MRRTERAILLLLFVALLAARLCHSRIVWVEEAYPTAAAIQMLDGKALYRDVWFDKPPLSAWVYTLWGAQTGVPLRIAGALYVFLCCLAIYFTAGRTHECEPCWHSCRHSTARHPERREESRRGTHECVRHAGMIAALLLAFFLTFDTPSAVLALAPDLLMILPHILAIYCAMRGWWLAAGLIAGVAECINPKAVFVLAACILFCRTWQAGVRILLGFAVPTVAVFAWYGHSYYDQVWQWGSVYAREGFSLSTGLVRTANWTGFHAAIVVAAAWALWKERSWRMAAWLALAFVAVCGGWRFFPRYFFQLVPPMVVLAARGYALLGRGRVLVLALLLIPAIRFGPRYVTLANDLAHGREPSWSDLRMNQDSQAASRLLNGKRGTLLVWGYRPDVYAYTRMLAGTRFLDSQPLTGVIADRHLTNATPSFPELAARNREELKRTSPTFIVDGLGPFNPALAITNYPDLREWLAGYREIGRTEGCVIYER